MMKKAVTRLAVLSVCVLTLTGCGKVSRQHIDEGMQAIAEQNYEQALTSLEEAESAGEDTRLLYRAKGLAFMGLTQYSDAAEAFETALKSSNGRVQNIDVDMNYYLATAYYKQGDDAQAIRIYNTILSLFPKEKDALYLRGSILLHQSSDNYESAKADFDRAIELAPLDFDQLLNICQVLKECGYQDAGREYLENAMANNAKDMSDYDKGRICFYLENYQDARDYLERAKDTAGGGAVLYLGRTWEILGDYNYASSVYEAYLTNTPDAEIYNQLGMCRLKMNDPQAALEAFQAGQTVENCPILQILQYNEIVACEQLENFTEAASLMQSYLKTYPDDEQAQRENIFLKTR